MADNISVTPGSGDVVAADEVNDASLGVVKVGYGKIMDGTPDSTNKLVVNSDGSAKVSDTAQAAILALIEANTDSINTLSVVLKTLVQGIVNPPYIDKSANVIRNQVQSGTITSVGTVTAVTTVSALTNIDSYQGKLLTVGQNMSAWASAVRRNIT